jgi:hypothetical protein
VGVVALYLVTGGFGSHDQYTGKWQIVSTTENGTPSPAPDPALFINIKKSGDAGGDHDVWFTQEGTTPLDHLGMQVVGGHLASGGSGPPIAITVANGTLTMTENGYNDAGAFDPIAYKAVRR